MKIAALQFNDKKERTVFWNSNSVQILENQSINIENVDVLFIHTNDFPKLDGRNKQKIIDFKGWKIYYTGNPNVVANVDAFKQEVNELIWETIESSYIEFISKINQGKTLLEAIYAMTGYDSELEKLLTPFASTSPFDTESKEGNDMKELKQKLRIYVEKYLM